MIWQAAAPLRANKSQVAKHALRVMLMLILLVPCSFILTFLLFPLWQGFENAFGINAIGHASIADWCFFATYSACALIVFLLIAMRKKT